MSGDEGFLRRWSRLKNEPASQPPQPAQPPLPVAAVAEPAAPAPLPSVDSLTSESDFAPFMRGGTDPQLRASALKKLFDDPRFNVMDGLDVYIDDYSKPDPLPEGWLEKLNQVARLGIFQPKPEPAEAESAPPQAPDEGGSAVALGATETPRVLESSNEPALAQPPSKTEI